MTAGIGYTQSSLLGAEGVSGPGIAIPAEWDTTTLAVSNKYASDMQILQGYLNLTNPPLDANGQPTGTATVLTQAQLAALTDPNAEGSIANALLDLINMAKNGITSPLYADDPSKGSQTSYLTTSMIAGLNTILMSFEDVGADIRVNPLGQAPTISISANQLQTWFNYAATTNTIGTAVAASISAAAFSVHSIQAMVELDYVRTANDILSTQLADLQQALRVTQDALVTLQNVQDLHSALDVEAFQKFTSRFNLNQGGSASSYINAYKTAASAYFNQPIKLTLKADSPFASTANFSQVLSNLRISLNREIAILQSAAGGSAGAYSLLSQITVVRNDISRYLDGGTPYQWLADGNTLIFTNGIGTINPNPTMTTVGQIQQNITNAITAGENFNDTQKNQVQNFLYVFQEFYQSASTILQNLTQIIERMAQHIAQ